MTLKELVRRLGSVVQAILATVFYETTRLLLLTTVAFDLDIDGFCLERAWIIGVAARVALPLLWWCLLCLKSIDISS